jgi:hypothetical protein
VVSAAYNGAAKTAVPAARIIKRFMVRLPLQMN